MGYQVTIRYGKQYQRYHTLLLDAEDLGTALRQAADALPPEINAEADLAELRRSIDPDQRGAMDPVPSGPEMER